MRNFQERMNRLFFLLITYISLPLLYAFISNKKNMKQNTGTTRVLFIPQLTRVGDLVCSTPVFRAVKVAYPESYVAVLVSCKVAGIIKHNTHIDEVIIYEDYSFLQLIKKIRKSNFNWSFSLSATSTSTLISLWGLIENRVKTTRLNRPITELATDWMNTQRLPYKDHTYLPRQHLNLLGFMGIENPKEIKEVVTTNRGDEKTKEFLDNSGVSSENILVGIGVSAGNKIKEWGDEKFLKLAERLALKHNAMIVFIGSLDDEERINKLLKKSPKNTFLKATSFSLEELPSLFKRLNLFIAVDTGLIYIAHALGVPLVDIIGPVDPREQPPQDQKSLQVLPSGDMSPSSFVFKKRGEMSDIKNAIESIGIEKVLTAANSLLESQRI